MNKSIRFVMTRMPALAVITLFGAIAGLALKASIEQLIGSNVLDAVVFALTAVLGAYGIHVALVIDRKLRSLSQLKWRLRRVNQVVELPREDSGQQLSIARFHNHTID